MNVETLDDLFVVELHRTYAIERRLSEELETLAAEVAVDALDDHGHVELREALTSAITDHRSETETHVERLEEALAAMDRQPEGRQTPALDGLFDEKELFNNVVLNDELRPVYYAGTAQAIERLEITAYERLDQLADHVDVPESVGETIEQNLADEEATLESLRELETNEAMSALLDELGASPQSP